MSKKHWIGRRNQKAGATAEEWATARLHALGVEMVETIHTGWKPVQWLNRVAGIAHVVPLEKVSGDRIGILPGSGRRVLAEVKTGENDRLIWSRLKRHQHDALAQNCQFGGLSLLVWITPMGLIHVMDYELLLRCGWKPGRSIDDALAAAAAWDGVPASSDNGHGYGELPY